MNLLNLGIFLIATSIATPQVRNKILLLEDYSNKLNIGLNSFPGKNEELIQKWIEKNHPQKPFFIKIQYGIDVGVTADATPIKGADIYVINPLKKIGFLWWKKYQFHILKEPEWTLFIKDSKPLNSVNIEKLDSLLFYH